MNLHAYLIVSLYCAWWCWWRDIMGAKLPVVLIQQADDRLLIEIKLDGLFSNLKAILNMNAESNKRKLGKAIIRNG